MIKIKSVDEAIKEIVKEEKEFRRKSCIALDFIVIRIQDIAKRMHPHYWKYRDRLLKEIQEWAKEHLEHCIWTDGETKWRIGYGQQMHPIFGFFNEITKTDILELYKVNEKLKGGGNL